VDKALAILKKNLLTIICGVVALLAMIALVYPLSGMRTKFKTDLTDRAKNYTRAQALLRESRFLPVVKPGAEPEPLSVFPTEQIITAGKTARDTVHDQSDQLMLKAIALNQVGHDLLFSPDILPIPGDHVFDYRSAYLDQVQRAIPAALGGVMPPNADEINKKITELHQTEVEDKIIKIGQIEVNRVQLEDAFNDLKAKLPDQLRRDSATKNKLYIDPSSLSINAIMTNPGLKPTPADVWYSQLSLWVQQDVARSIIAANNSIPQSNIQTDAIKRLVQLRVPGDVSIYVQSAGAAAPTDDSGGGDPRDFTRSPTGHVCNDLYDVVQCSLVIEADQTQLPLILRELQRDKLTSVLGVEITPVDAATADAQGFMYGTAPMVQLSITLESLFMRKWTLPLMPEEVKTELHIAPPPPAATN
jgi:hypothetical protein